MQATANIQNVQRMSVKIAETILSRSVDGYHPNIGNKWGYVAGMALTAIGRPGDWAEEPRYHEFVKRHMDVFIQEDGSIQGGYALDDYNLDHINKGKHLMRLWKETGEAKYEKAARLLETQLIGQPRTEEGGFWHKKIYHFPNVAGRLVHVFAVHGRVRRNVRRARLV